MSLSSVGEGKADVQKSNLVDLCGIFKKWSNAESLISEKGKFYYREKSL